MNLALEEQWAVSVRDHPALTQRLQDEPPYCSGDCSGEVKLADPGRRPERPFNADFPPPSTEDGTPCQTRAGIETTSAHNAHDAARRSGQDGTHLNSGLSGLSSNVGPVLRAVVPEGSLSAMARSKKGLRQLNLSGRDCRMCKGSGDGQQVIKANLNKKYLTSRDSYNVKVINDIIYNENTHLVSVFKDYLIYDDVSEFLRRYYNRTETHQRLPKITDYYSKYSKVFPNYFQFKESKYMFKNIKKKQRAIDEGQQNVAEGRKKRPRKLEDDFDENRLFTTHAILELNKSDSILGRSQRQPPPSEVPTQMQSYLRTHEHLRPAPEHIHGHTRTRLEELNLQDLVERFIVKDSQSLISITPTPKATAKENREGGKQPDLFLHLGEKQELPHTALTCKARPPASREKPLGKLDPSPHVPATAANPSSRFDGKDTGKRAATSRERGKSGSHGPRELGVKPPQPPQPRSTVTEAAKIPKAALPLGHLGISEPPSSLLVRSHSLGRCGTSQPTTVPTTDVSRDLPHKPPMMIETGTIGRESREQAHRERAPGTAGHSRRSKSNMGGELKTKASYPAANAETERNKSKPNVGNTHATKGSSPARKQPIATDHETRRKPPAKNPLATQKGDGAMGLGLGLKRGESVNARTTTRSKTTSHTPRTTTPSRAGSRATMGQAKTTMGMQLTGHCRFVSGKDEILEKVCAVANQKRQGLDKVGFEARTNNFKGLAIDIESINKSLQKHKVAIAEAKTLQSGRPALHDPASRVPSHQTPDHLHDYKSEYLNSLRAKHTLHPTGGSQDTRTLGHSEVPTPPELLHRIKEVAHPTVISNPLSGAKNLGLFEKTREKEGGSRKAATSREARAGGCGKAKTEQRLGLGLQTARSGRDNLVPKSTHHVLLEGPQRCWI